MWPEPPDEAQWENPLPVPLVPPSSTEISLWSAGATPADRATVPASAPGSRDSVLIWQDRENHFFQSYECLNLPSGSKWSRVFPRTPINSRAWRSNPANASPISAHRQEPKPPSGRDPAPRGKPLKRVMVVAPQRTDVWTGICAEKYTPSGQMSITPGVKVPRSEKRRQAEPSLAVPGTVPSLGKEIVGVMCLSGNGGFPYAARGASPLDPCRSPPGKGTNLFHRRHGCVAGVGRQQGAVSPSDLDGLFRGFS
jgi:hypothetical protein